MATSKQVFYETIFGPDVTGAILARCDGPAAVCACPPALVELLHRIATISKDANDIELLLDVVCVCCNAAGPPTETVRAGVANVAAAPLTQAAINAIREGA